MLLPAQGICLITDSFHWALYSACTSYRKQKQQKIENQNKTPCQQLFNSKTYTMKINRVYAFVFPAHLQAHKVIAYILRPTAYKNEDLKLSTVLHFKSRIFKLFICTIQLLPPPFQ